MIDACWRIAYRIGFLLALIWWRVRRPAHEGALVAVWLQGRVLVVRQSDRRTRSFPGGGIRPGEDPRAAAVRELGEEVGLKVDPAALVAAWEQVSEWDFRQDHVRIFELVLAGPPTVRLDGREVVAAGFLPPERGIGAAVGAGPEGLSGRGQGARSGRPPGGRTGPSGSAAVQRGFSGGKATFGMFRRLLLALPLVLAPAVLTPVVAARCGEPTDAELARTAVERGEIRPLADILAAVEARYEGQVIATELEHHHDRWIYEFKLLPPTGRIYKVRVDATSGQLLETHGPAEERPEEQH